MDAQWLTAIYSLAICVGAGLLVFLGIFELADGAGAVDADGAATAAHRVRRAAAVGAVVLLLLGVGAFACALGRPSSIMAVLANVTGGSPKSLEFACALACLVAAAAYAVAWSRTDSAGVLKGIGAVCLVAGCALGLLAGFSAAIGRPAMTVGLVAAYLGNALAMGGAIYAALGALFGCDDRGVHAYGLGALVGIGVQAVGMVAYGACAGWTTGGLLLWGGGLAVGCGIAAACEGLVLAKRWTRVLAVVAALACIAGGLCLRAAVLSAGTGSLGLLATAAMRVAL